VVTLSFCRYGAPQEFVTDNGPQFISKEMRELLREFSLKAPLSHTLPSPSQWGGGTVQPKLKVDHTDNNRSSRTRLETIY
jgi:hypothetical protein